MKYTLTIQAENNEEREVLKKFNVPYMLEVSDGFSSYIPITLNLTRNLKREDLTEIEIQILSSLEEDIENIGKGHWGRL